MTRLTVIITAYREADTLGRALDAFLPQLPPDAELLVVTPDPETCAVAEDYAARYANVRHLLDPQQGKPTALLQGLRAAAGEIVILSDGDVRVAADALAPLLAPFADEEVGAVTGRPLSTNSRQSKLGYWSYFLTYSAHQLRLQRDRDNKFLLCSGYLFAFRRALITDLPPDALAEDAVISHRIAQAGYRIRYAPAARVWVNYPTTYADWLRQKVRSAGGYAQDYIRSSPVRMRSAGREALSGLRLARKFAHTPRELWWLGLLFAARLHLWGLVLINVRLLQKPLAALWQRVETTKGQRD